MYEYTKEMQMREKKKSFIFTNTIKNPGFFFLCKTSIETTTFGYNLFFNLFQHRQKRVH